MPKPVILTVDDDPQVLRAVARDLRGHYGDRYRVVRAESGDLALQTLHELRERKEAVALLLADQRMPQMDGVRFLQQATEVYPDAKRALLTAYADTEAAIAAINSSRVHYYLLKPWDPPEEKLFPVLDDLLEDWQGNYRPPFTGIRLIGDRWSADAHELRDFLARSHVPYRWLDADGEDGQGMMTRLELGIDDLPAVVFEDDSVARHPSTVEVAERAGLRTQPDSDFYDLVIVGAGPAGLAAAVYGASEGLSVALLDGNAPGGQAGTSSRIENYLGFPAGLSGGDLARRAVTQARRFGAEIISPQTVLGLEIAEHYKRVLLSGDRALASHALILATGVSYSKLDLPGLAELEGAGVYYGSSISEAVSCQNEQVFVVGAGNSAGQAAMFLADYAARVTMLVRGDDLGSKMSNYLVERIEAHPKIEVRLGTRVTAVSGSGHLERVTVTSANGSEACEASALFVFIGAHPQTDWVGDLVVRDERGFVLTGRDVEGSVPWPLERPPFLLETSVPGVFAAGDVRHGSVKRVASAVGEGSISVQFVHRFLAEVGAR